MKLMEIGNMMLMVIDYIMESEGMLIMIAP